MAGPREPDPGRAYQQTVPAPGQRESQRLHLKPQEDGHGGNQTWGDLQKRITSILCKLKHFINQCVELETGSQDSIVRLTEIDLQLTSIEHFSDYDIQAKIKQLEAFQQEISVKHRKIEQIIAQGKQLIERASHWMLLEQSDPLDADREERPTGCCCHRIEEELGTPRCYCQEVFGRVERHPRKLIRLPYQMTMTFRTRS